MLLLLAWLLLLLLGLLVLLLSLLVLLLRLLRLLLLRTVQRALVLTRMRGTLLSRLCLRETVGRRVERVRLEAGVGRTGLCERVLLLRLRWQLSVRRRGRRR